MTDVHPGIDKRHCNRTLALFRRIFLPCGKDMNINAFHRQYVGAPCLRRAALCARVPGGKLPGRHQPEKSVILQSPLIAPVII